jgi:phosphoglycerate dehydrogenase-like enzyme
VHITIAAADNEFGKTLLSRLQSADPDDTVVLCTPGSELPTATEVLLTVGKVDAATIKPLQQLKLVQTISDGYETVDEDAITDAGIWLSYAPAGPTGNGHSVAEYAVFLLLAAARQLNKVLNAMKSGGSGPMFTESLKGKTVCIYGYGDIGQALAKCLSGLECKLIAIDHHAAGDAQVKVYKDEAEALPLADFVVLCVRASEDNKHMVNAEFLKQMKPTAAIVNIARGSLIDETALLAALREGTLGGAALDVVEHEPLKPEDPLAQQPNVFVTPHIAFHTQLMLNGTVEYLADVIAHLRKGERWDSLLNDPKPPRIALR